MRISRSTPRAANHAAIAMMLIAGGCSNPFRTEESDFGRQVSKERLREIERLTLDRFKSSAPAATPEEVPKELRSRFEGLSTVEIDLEDCRTSVLTNNLDLKVARLDPTIAGELVSEEEGRFDSVFALRALWNETDSPTSSTLDSATSQNRFLEPSVRVPLRTGETVSVGLPMNRNSTDNSFSTLNPASTTDLDFSVSQPLLRGGGRRATMAPLKIAAYGTQATEARTKLEVIRQLAAADRAYWLLYQRRRELEVAQQQYELAETQLQRAERRVAAGDVAEIEIIRAQSGLGERLQAIILSQTNVLLQQRELKRIVNDPGLPLDSTAMVVPTSPPDPVEYIFDTNAAVAAALDRRMEMLELELRLAADAVEIDLARNRALPLFTMDYSYRINGLGEDRSESVRVMGENRFEDWSVGLNAEVPLGNEQAMSRVRRSVLTRIQRLATREARESAIKQEVLDACDTITSGWQRILASRQATILDERSFKAEQRAFDVGNSTSTDVLNAAARLAESQVSEIRALTDYQISQVDLAFAAGVLLGASKIVWEPAPTVDERLTSEDLFRTREAEPDGIWDAHLVPPVSPQQTEPVVNPEVPQ